MTMVLWAVICVGVGVVAGLVEGWIRAFRKIGRLNGRVAELVAALAKERRVRGELADLLDDHVWCEQGEDGSGQKDLRCRECGCSSGERHDPHCEVGVAVAASDTLDMEGGQ